MIRKPKWEYFIDRRHEYILVSNRFLAARRRGGESLMADMADAVMAGKDDEEVRL
jgi:hypothetical protein